MEKKPGIKTYLVGGAVRDMVMHKEPKDRDYVVVGATPEYMISNNFKTVGADFPVFLHPETGEEYALARVERKTGIGYQGFTCEFSPTVTLEEDLYRRDIRMNAIAFDEETGEYIDPYGGIQDIKDGVIRHVSKHFAEDPLRVLRVARFAARYGFTVHADTLKMMTDLVWTDDYASLADERIFTEFMKAMSETHASKFVQTIASVGGLAPTFGVIPVDVEILKIMSNNIDKFSTPEDKLLYLVFSMTGTSLERFEEKFKLPANFKLILEKTNRQYNDFGAYTNAWMDGEKDYVFRGMMRLLKDMDIVRRPVLLETFLRMMAVYDNDTSFTTFVAECADCVRNALKETTIPDGLVGKQIKEFMDGVYESAVERFVYDH